MCLLENAEVFFSFSEGVSDDAIAVLADICVVALKPIKNCIECRIAVD